MEQSYDYLIVGQGLAGTLLANELLTNGVKVFIVDNAQGESSSKVAAGIFNPITGKRFVKTWLCDEIYPNIISFYQNLEKQFGKSFLNITPIFRPVSNIKEQNQIIEIADNPQIEPYLNFVNTPDEIKNITEANFGGLISKIGGWLDVPFFLDQFKNYFMQQSIYENQIFNFEELNFDENGVIWQNKKFDKIIFCEGYGAVKNPFFNWLPFNAVKGEVINIEADFYLENYILLKGIFVVSTGRNKYKIGATYNWADKTFENTEEGIKELTEKLNKLIPKDYKVTGQKAGIRPATIDRRPFIGMHPLFGNIGIFNGLGTKGVSLGPYFAKEFTDFLINRKQLNPDVNINRFSSLYLSSNFNFNLQNGNQNLDD